MPAPLNFIKMRLKVKYHTAEQMQKTFTQLFKNTNKLLLFVIFNKLSHK